MRHRLQEDWQGLSETEFQLLEIVSAGVVGRSRPEYSGGGWKHKHLKTCECRSLKGPFINLTSRFYMLAICFILVSGVKKPAKSLNLS